MNIALSNIDIIIFVGFLVINLIAGLSYGKDVKTLKDYALGGRNFSTAALVSTIVATCVTGSVFFVSLSKIYSDGLYFFIPALCSVLQMLITAYFLIPRMEEFLGNTSVAEALGNLYGTEARLIIAVCGILSMVGYIAVQFKVFGNIFSYFLGIDPTYAIFLAAGIVILYSSFGGIKAVTYTDVVQFITFGFGIPLIGIILWNHISDANISITSAIQGSNFDWNTIFNLNNSRLWAMLPLIFYFTVPSTDPSSFQRISMGRSVSQAKKAWLVSAILFGLVLFSIAWIPFLIKITAPNLQPNQVINYLIDNYTYTGLKGLIIIGIFAMAMSTADSCINASAVLFANDIGKVLGIKIGELTLSRAFSGLLGIFSIYLALSKADLLSIIMATASFYLPIVTVPLLLAIFGFRSTKIPVLVGMVAGFIVVFTSNLLKIEADSIIFIGMAANIVCFLGSHYLLKQPGGWVGIKDRRYLDEVKLERKRKIAKFLVAVRNFNFIEFCKKSSPKDELTYMWLGIYFILYTLTTMYSTQVELLKDNGKVILIIYQVMMITGVLMAMYPIWPARIKREIIVQVAWYIAIFYMLIFFSCFFVMISNFGQMQFSVFILNMLIAAVLTGWRMGIAMAVIGFYSSLEFYKYYTGLDTIDTSIGSSQFMFVYALMFAGSVLLIFFKPEQEHQDLTRKRNIHLADRIGSQEIQVRKALGIREEFIRNIQHEYNTPMTGILSMADALKSAYYYLSDERRLKAIDDILQSAEELKIYDENLQTLARLSKNDYKLERTDIDFSDLVYNRLDICRKLYEENKGDREFILNIEDKITLNGDKRYLTQVLDNLIINAISYCKEGKIDITLRQDKNNVQFIIADEGIGIPPEELGSIFGEFMVSSRTRTYAGGRGVGLALARRVIEVHGGNIKAESDGRKGAKFTFVLPKK